jgi:hypothetical protein
VVSLAVVVGNGYLCSCSRRSPLEVNGGAGIAVPSAAVAAGANRRYGARTGLSSGTALSKSWDAPRRGSSTLDAVAAVLVCVTEAVKGAVVTAGIALAGALVGAFAGQAGVRQTLNAAAEQQERQFEEARLTEASKERADVYAQLLAAANTFAVQASAASTAAESSGTVESDVALLYQTARSAFQIALNDVYIYGSDDGYRAAVDLASTLPPSLGRLDGSFTISGVDDDFAERYQAVLRISCRELPSTPRGNCR